MSRAAVLDLIAFDYQCRIDVEHGASIAYLRWKKPDGSWFEVFRPCPPAKIADLGGSFVLAPFANRLDAGRFETREGPVEVAVNEPRLNYALHGLSRDLPWHIIDLSPDAITLCHEINDEESFAYRMTQTIAITPDGVMMTLELINRSERVMPFGIGFHPWFTKDEDTWLKFCAETAFDRDERGFAQNILAAGQDPFALGIKVSGMPFYSGHFSGWNARVVEIQWRASGVKLDFWADGALTNIHLYNAGDDPVMCVEPVSHFPDVHNRRPMAQYGDVAWLKQGESIAGSWKLRLSDLPAVNSF